MRLLLCCGLLLLVACQADDPPTPPPLRTVDIPASLTDYQLSADSASCSRSPAFVTCEGFVTNLSKHPLSSVQAVVVYKAAGTPVSSDTALITYDPLLPGQQSPWKVISRDNPSFDEMEVEFTLLFGSSLRVRYDY